MKPALLVIITALLFFSCEEFIQTLPPSVLFENSFESNADTSGWEGIAEFQQIVSGQAGNQSIFISGGCILPHFGIGLGPYSNDMTLSLECWGKAHPLDGSVDLYVQGQPSQMISIYISDTNWNYIHSPDSLFLTAGDSAYLMINSGGIVMGGMLVDYVKIQSN